MKEGRKPEYPEKTPGDELQLRHWCAMAETLNIPTLETDTLTTGPSETVSCDQSHSTYIRFVLCCYATLFRLLLLCDAMQMCLLMYSM